MSTSELAYDVTEESPAFRTDVETMAEECTSFVASVVDATGADGVVVTLDGDVDSTTAAAVAVEALGTGAVYGLVLPAASDEADVRDAQEAAFELGISFRTVDVQPIVDAVTGAVRRDHWVREMATLSIGADRPVRACEPLENRETYTEAVAESTAHARAMATSFEATLRNRLVLGPATRTELALGGATPAGAGGVDLLPLGDRYVTEVRRLAEILDVPEFVAEKPSTVGARKGLADVDDSGTPSETVDAVLRKLVDEGCGIERTAAELGVDRSLVADCEAAFRDTERPREVPPTPGTHFS